MSSTPRKRHLICDLLISGYIREMDTLRTLSSVIPSTVIPMIFEYYFVNPDSNGNSVYFFKLVLIGDDAVGKSNLLLRFANNLYSNSFVTTTGCDFKICTRTINMKPVKLQIWDTAGKEVFIYRGADAFIMVYDVTNRESFQNISKRWLPSLESNGAKESAPKILIGNKADFKDAYGGSSDRKVDAAEGKSLADELSIFFMEVSARTSRNVEKAFSKIIEQLIAQRQVDDPFI